MATGCGREPTGRQFNWQAYSGRTGNQHTRLFHDGTSKTEAAPQPKKLADIAGESGVKIARLSEAMTILRYAPKEAERAMA